MSNIDVYIVVEGQTERTFIRDIVAPELGHKGICLYPVLIGKAGHKGGNVTFERMRKDVANLLKARSGTYVSTMLDFTRIDTIWPGHENLCQQLKSGTDLNASKKAKILETATANKIAEQLPKYDTKHRFIPYIEMHEFEALLFSDAQKLANETGINPKQIQEILEQYDNPEEINGTPEKAPGHRLGEIKKGYKKIVMGMAVAKAIGIQKIRAQCPHFNDWLQNLEHYREKP